MASFMVKLGMRFDPNSDSVQNVFHQPTTSSDSLISWNPFWTAELDCIISERADIEATGYSPGLSGWSKNAAFEVWITEPLLPTKIDASSKT